MVAAVGPTCHAILQAHGVDVQVIPEHPKMGPLVVALMRHLDRGVGHREQDAPSEARPHTTGLLES